MQRRHEVNDVQVLLHTNNTDDDKLLINTLSQSKLIFEVTNSDADILKHLTCDRPKVLLVSNEEIEQSLSLYFRSLAHCDDQQLVDHALVLCCSRQQERQAHELFMQGIINDYLITRPTYEVLRPVEVVYHLLHELGIYAYPDNDRFIEQACVAVNQEDDEIVHGIERKYRFYRHHRDQLQQLNRLLIDCQQKLRQQSSLSESLSEINLVISRFKQLPLPAMLVLHSSILNLLTLLMRPFVKNSDHEPSRRTSQKPATSSKDKEVATDKTDDVDNDSSKADSQESTSDAMNNGSEKREARKPKQITTLQNKSDNDDSTTQLAPASSGKQRVLLVEDDTMSAMVSQKLLESMGFSVDWTSLGRRAISLLKERSYSLILMDIYLPDTDGLLVVDQLGHMQCINSDTPVSILTSKKHRSLVTRAMQAGANEYILKPLTKDAVRFLCQQHQISLAC
ncbi:Histidine kinase [Saliniradius amylolyticus]|uniref:Histidine kinase n=1 Tax=Saliniradius amylolyticus TaxID=2183582 RepID=A0A2S2E5C4_9ALTE|nr:response regulator [Saliniradius amylolyticus]AWL12177.1 Histidine kinase [Saliniradius amylolyticus]